MDDIILIVVLCLLFHTSIINGQPVDLSFNTSMYNGTDDYYAHIGEDVILTCTVPSTKTRVYMYKGTSRRDYETLVKDGELVSEHNGKYSFVPSDGKYQLHIHNLYNSDRLHYGCAYCSPFHCFSLLINIVIVFLDVRETTHDDSQIPDYCDLVTNTDGIFFTGNDLILRCPKGSFNFTASNGSSTFRVEFGNVKEGTVFNRLAIKNLTEKFNETRLSCLNVENSKEYCRHFPDITVFNELTIKLSPGRREITNGESVNFTCHTHPFLPLTIEWNILDNNVILGNVSESEISQGIRISINNVEFLNSTSSSLAVICNVTIGSENSSQTASVYLEMEDVATTRVTSLVSEVNSTQLAVSATRELQLPGTTLSAESDQLISPISIVVPITVVIIILGIIILGLVYVKARKSATSKEADRQHDNIKQGVGNVEENAYYIKNNEKTELGLTNHDSDVVDNVAYASYDDAYQKG